MQSRRWSFAGTSLSRLLTQWKHCSLWIGEHKSAQSACKCMNMSGILVRNISDCLQAAADLFDWVRKRKHIRYQVLGKANGGPNQRIRVESIHNCQRSPSLFLKRLAEFRWVVCRLTYVDWPQPELLISTRIWGSVLNRNLCTYLIQQLCHTLEEAATVSLARGCPSVVGLFPAGSMQLFQQERCLVDA